MDLLGLPAWPELLLISMANTLIPGNLRLDEAYSGFLESHGQHYGLSHVQPNSPHQRAIHTLRQQGFSRLRPSDDQPYGITPLDQAGSALYSEQQLSQVFQELSASILSNPHSATQPGALPATHHAELVRHTLSMCNASSEEYDVVLTAGATSAMKLVAESLPWCSQSVLAHARNVHNSVLGMREQVLQAGGTVHVLDLPHSPPATSPIVPTCSTTQPTTCDTASDTTAIPPPSAPAPDGVLLRPAALPICRRQQQVTPQQGSHVGSTSTGSQVPGEAVHAAVHLVVLPHECNFTGQAVDLRLVDDIKGGRELAWIGSGHVGSAAGVQGCGDNSAASNTTMELCTAGGQTQHSASQQREEQQQEGQDRGVSWQHDQQGVQGGQEGAASRWWVMLDAAKSCATAPPDLSRHAVDLVALSYYKIFGYPTGLGALIVRKSLLPVLTHHKRYFGGGTVASSCAEEDFMIRRSGPAGLEDGTLPFTAISAARHGFELLRQLGGHAAIKAHTRALCEYLCHQLSALRHSNDTPLAVIYGRPAPGSDPAAQFPGVCGWGPVVAFNLKRPDGSWVGYHEVSRLAVLHGIQLRTGCFCNPGACTKYLGLTGADIRENYAAGHVCWDDNDIMSGKPTGAVRVSLGHTSLFQDVHYFIRFICHYFIDRLESLQRPTATTTTTTTSTPTTNAASAGGLLLPPDDECALVARLSTAAREATREATRGADPASTADPCQLSDGSAGTTTPLGSAAQGATPATPLTLPPGSSTAAAVSAAAGGSSSTGSTAGAGSSPSSTVVAEPLAKLSAIYVYPIKSCGAQQVSRWPVGRTGLLYDREWALVDDTGKVVTQKACPRAALVTPHVDLTCRTLTISAPGMQGDLVLQLEADGDQQQRAAGTTAVQDGASLVSQQSRQGDGTQSGSNLAQITVCGDHVCGTVITQAATQFSLNANSPAGNGSVNSVMSVRQWFDAAIGIPCSLVRQQAGERLARPGTGGTGRYTTAELEQQQQSAAGVKAGRAREVASGKEKGKRDDGGAPIGFANDGQYLLVNAASVADVNSRIAAVKGLTEQPPTTPQVELLRFRPNLVVSGLAAYAEDAWRSMVVGSLKCDVLGTCPRCEMLQVDQGTGVRGRPDVLLALAQYRRFNGRMHFGILLSSANDDADQGTGAVVELSVGDVVQGNAL